MARAGKSQILQGSYSLLRRVRSTECDKLDLMTLIRSDPIFVGLHSPLGPVDGPCECPHAPRCHLGSTLGSLRVEDLPSTTCHSTSPPVSRGTHEHHNLLNLLLHTFSTRPAISRR